MKIVNIAVKRPVTVWMFTLAVVLFGMVSLSRLSVTLLPELSYPSLTIRTNYEGAAPAEVEQLVSKPIEEALGIVKGVRNIQSISRPGQWKGHILGFSKMFELSKICQQELEN